MNLEYYQEYVEIRPFDQIYSNCVVSWIPVLSVNLMKLLKQLLLADLKFNYKFYSNKKLAIQTIFRIYILYYYFYTKLCYVHVERE